MKNSSRFDSMQYYPANLDISNRKCLVVGGGRVGRRKVNALLQCGGAVVVVSIDCVKELCLLAEKQVITLLRRPYHASDLENVFLVFAATADVALNRRIAEDAHRLKVLCNIVDSPQYCDFIVPSTLRRGDLAISISTSGKSPAVAKRIRRQLETEFGNEYAILLDIMGNVRQALLEQEHDPDAHQAAFEKLLDSDILERIRARDATAVQTILNEVLGESFRFGNMAALRIDGYI